MKSNIGTLVTMANQIGGFFDTLSDRQQSLAEIAGHLKRFWEPRMRLALLAHVDEQAGAGLSDTVLESVRLHRASLVPAVHGATHGRDTAKNPQ